MVTGDEVPVVTEGYHVFTAHIGTPSSMIHWSVDDSRTLFVDPDTTFTTWGQQVTLFVSAGSYTLTFRVGQATPIYQQEIPVCTGSGGVMLLDPKGPPGGTTQATGNCPPPEDPE